uniref:Uncharacterized protein n=1 Tax=Anguilla anguilla TaxID=7936 RepID=A0A0E9T560_ANGAN
MLPPLAVTSGL